MNETPEETGVNNIALSPLQEADPRSLDEFMSRDPFQYGKQDRLQVFKLLREQRAKWESLKVQGKRQTKGAAKAGASVVKESPKAMNIEDLFSND